MGRENIFSDEMDRSRPVTLDGRRGEFVFECGQIIHQCIEPDISDIVPIKRQLNAP